MPTPVKSLRSVCWKSKDNVECLAVLSDRICSFGAIDDGSWEQYCRMDGKGKSLGKQSVLRAYVEKIWFLFVSVCRKR